MAVTTRKRKKRRKKKKTEKKDRFGNSSRESIEVWSCMAEGVELSNFACADTNSGVVGIVSFRCLSGKAI